MRRKGTALARGAARRACRDGGAWKTRAGIPPAAKRPRHPARGMPQAEPND